MVVTATTVERHDTTKCDNGEYEESTERGGDNQKQESTEKDRGKTEEVEDIVRNTTRTGIL
jgi:hypothetical protein